MARLEINLLGPYVVTLDGQPVEFTYEKVRALLAILCVEHGHKITREWASASLWPDQPQNAALDSLRQALSRLRSALDDRENKTPFLLVSRETLQFNSRSSVWIDFTNFEDLLMRCAGHRHRSLPGCPACYGWLGEAAGLYRGSFLADFSLPESDLFEDWRAAWRERLERQVMKALDDLVSGSEGRGDDRQVLEWAARQLEIDPYLEPAHRQLMKALVRSGRRSQAVAHYQRMQAQFQKELDLTPEPETQSLEKTIRAGEITSSPLREIRGLPAPANPLVGRAVERSELETWLSDPGRRIISVVGPGGIGKTRLVIEVAQRQAVSFADGGVYLSFSMKMGPGTLTVALANALGLPALDLAKKLSEKDLLLVLDGCEHLFEDVGTMTGLLEAAPHLVVLAASRERLGLPGEWVFGLGGLEVPPLLMNDRIEAYSAVALFEQSARQVCSNFTLTPENRPAVGEICRLVGGVPLALHLSAAWVRVLPVAEIAAQIYRSLDILAAAPAGSSGSHSSVRAVFEQSWQRLDQREQEAFMELAVFQDGFDREGAEQVADASLETLARLVDSSFLRLIDEKRYSMHDLLLQFAREKLVQAGLEESVRNKHFTYFLKLARKKAVDLSGPDGLKSFFWLSRESANLQTALAWAEQNDAERAGPFAELTRQGIHRTGINQIIRGDIKFDISS
jgi:predicted ATPase/DNA-binding SARP family transcriptional activator